MARPKNPHSPNKKLFSFQMDKSFYLDALATCNQQQIPLAFLARRGLKLALEELRTLKQVK